LERSRSGFATCAAAAWQNRASPASAEESPMTATDTIQARFNPLVRPYLVLYVAWILLLTVVFSPLIVIWVLGLGQW
jgi:hypothetical protein